MFQVATPIVIFVYVIFAFFGAAIGAVSGILFSVIFKLRAQGIVKDALFGAIGFVLTVIGCAVIPWPRNTISESVGPGLTVQTTMDRFQHPYIAAIIIAAALPALHQLFRLKRAGRKK
jgi:H+/Cl- antiporter ClcA